MDLTAANMGIADMGKWVSGVIEHELDIPRPGIPTGAPPVRSRDDPVPITEAGKWGNMIRFYPSDDLDTLSRKLNAVGYALAYQLRKQQKPRVFVPDEAELTDNGWLYRSLDSDSWGAIFWVYLPLKPGQLLKLESS